MDDNKTGMLYLCATPIGNLEDITLRALRILKEADIIAAEDTRGSIKLLNHFDIKTPMTSYHEHNKYDKGRTLVAEMLSGKNVALITDAGTPGISDPGEELVRQCYDAGVPVTSLPGACACVNALVISGMPTKNFVFEAFLPADKKDRRERLESLKEKTETIVMYESPHRLRKTLKELDAVLGPERRMSVVKELTKVHENVFMTTIGGAVAFYESEEPRGEYVLVIEGMSAEEKQQKSREVWEDMSVREHFDMYVSQGLDKKDAMKSVARDRGVAKNVIYKELL